MSPPVDTIYTLARQTLDAVRDGWPADQPKLPTRQYVTVGQPAFDAAQLVVSVARTIGVSANVGQQGIHAEHTDLWWMRTAIFVVQLLRDVDTVDSEGVEIQIPTAETIEDEAQIILGDAQCLLNVIMDAHEQAQLGGCGNIAFETWDAIDAGGKLAGGALRVRFGLW